MPSSRESALSIGNHRANNAKPHGTQHPQTMEIMTDRSDQQSNEPVHPGGEPAFEHLYDLHHARVRLIAWRITHRADWLDDLLNEAWCRAFDQRQSYDPGRPFPVWMAGILRNVYREFCRKSARAAAPEDERRMEKIDEQSPETIALEAEVLAGLEDCLGRLDAGEARIIRLRFFDGKPLRSVAKEVSIPESTLRETRIPALLDRLRRCLAEKKIDFSEVFSAQSPDETQGTGGD